MSKALSFDLEGALSRVEQDRDLLIELVQIFFEEFPVSIARLDSAVQQGNNENLELAAHSLKSAAGNVGAMAAYETAYQLEKAGRNKVLEQAPLLLTKLRLEVEEFKARFLEFKATI